MQNTENSLEKTQKTQEVEFPGNITGFKPFVISEYSVVKILTAIYRYIQP